MASPKKLLIDEGAGDGGLIGVLPKPLRPPVRRLVMRRDKGRGKRLMRVAASVYPVLRTIETIAMAGGKQMLAGKEMEEALANPLAIERALMLFQVARETGLVAIDTGDAKTTGGKVPACGMSIAEAEAWFTVLAAERLFAENPQAFELMKPYISQRAMLPRLKILARMDTLGLDELQAGLGSRFRMLLADRDEPFVEALSRWKAFQIRALRGQMGSQFMDLINWEPERIQAMGEGFQCVEQFRDLGDAILELTDPESVRAVARWDKRDITDRVNAERAKKGKKVMKGRRFETDIGIMARLLGAEFGPMLQRGPGVIEGYYAVLLELRAMQAKERAERVEQIQQFTRRYLDYLTGDMMKALSLVNREAEDVLTFPEINSLVDGLWAKQGLGAAFFEGPFQTPEGVQAVRSIVHEFCEMKRRGSAKSGTDIAGILTNSDLFDKFLVPFMKKAPIR